MKETLRLVKDRHQFFKDLSALGPGPYYCQLWQLTSLGRVSIERKVRIDQANGQLSLDSQLETLDISLPIYFYFKDVNFAFKAQVDPSSPETIQLPTLFCTTERRKENRFAVISGLGVKLNFRGEIISAEIIDIAQSGISLRTSDVPFREKDEIVISGVPGLTEGEVTKATVVHLAKYAYLEGSGENNVKFDLHIGLSLDTPWSFNVESVYQDKLNKDQTKKDIYKVCMVTEKEKQEIEEEAQKIYDQLKDTKFGALFKTYLSQKDTSYLKWHSNMCAILSMSLAKKLEWVSEGTTKKYIIACHLHDLPFVEHPRLAEIHNKAEMDLLRGTLTPQEIFLYENHPKLAASLASNLTNLSSDIEKILFQQKELSDGSGYPMGLNHAKITPLSTLFIVCHDLADYLYFENKPEVQKYCMKLRDKYKGQSFYKVINAAIELFK